MKKITLICLSVLTVVLFALTAVGCGHKHTWTWKTDKNETQHWKVCDECGEGFEFEDHVFNEPVHYNADTYYEERTEKYCPTCYYTHVEYVEGTLVGTSYENAAVVDCANKPSFNLRENTTYYFKVKGSSSNRFMDASKASGSNLFLSYAIYADNDAKTLLNEIKDEPFGIHIDPKNVSYSATNINSKAGTGSAVYIKITTAEELIIRFSN